MSDSGRGQTTAPPGAVWTNVWFEEEEELFLPARPQHAPAETIPVPRHEAIVWIEEKEDLAQVPPTPSDGAAVPSPPLPTSTNVWIEAEEQV